MAVTFPLCAGLWRVVVIVLHDPCKQCTMTISNGSGTGCDIPFVCDAVALVAAAIFAREGGSCYASTRSNFISPHVASLPRGNFAASDA